METRKSAVELIEGAIIDTKSEFPKYLERAYDWYHAAQDGRISARNARLAIEEIERQMQQNERRGNGSIPLAMSTR